ncbi:MAG: ABC-F family ATP-binding cassette domain-containing protein [candidate division KSB1 bacterium]|jgi:ATP-binding cassette subfamily F protein 3|nr:ABC-F family ATP-binding cassette domain-containing protein [candidate division KSB1 bacterium]
MLQIKNLKYSIGERILLSGLDWVIREGRRAALIGPNGAGKTTLLKIITGELKADSGDIMKPREYTIGCLPQDEVSAGRGSVLQVVLEGQRHIIDIEDKMAEIQANLDRPGADHDRLAAQLGELQHRYESLGGYRMESTARAILTGLGFDPGELNRHLAEFSGGWRMRAYLARLLIRNPDLLLLDEPTNHLDLPSLEWLEQYLMGFDGGIVIVSHDRYFIDRLSEEIYELENGKLEYYPGNYHFYEEKKEVKRAQTIKRWEELRAEREKQERFINRFRAKNTKATQVQSRIKQLEKMETIELPPSPRQLNFTISSDVQSYKDVLKIENMSFAYDSEWVLEEISLNLYRGDRVALVGVNGAGKTTLTKLINNQLQPQEGVVRIGQRVHIGYYAQHQVDTLDLNASIYEEVASTVSAANLPGVRNTLGLFQFSGEDINKKIDVLSGGEKARVSLAKILLSPVNFLIMDEPTNHLDAMSRDALENALMNFDGTLLLISHDRYFLDKIIGRVIEVRDHTLREFEGNYSYYLSKREESILEKPVAAQKVTSISANRKTREQKRIEAEARQAVSKERRSLEKEIADAEAQIEKMEDRKKEIEDELALPDTYQYGGHVSVLQKEYASLQKDLQALYGRWEKAQDGLEKLMRQINKD